MKISGIILAICLLFSLYQEKAKLDIEITNIRSPKGVIRLSIYTRSDQYPFKPFKTYEVKKESLNQGRIHTSINDLSPGQYGLCFLDDENRSGQMESNLFGIPLEGFGFANNPKLFLKKPEYDRIVFRLDPGSNRIQLITRYKN
jgi:uncharacterized protein (DUF2141 family)